MPYNIFPTRTMPVRALPNHPFLEAYYDRPTQFQDVYGQTTSIVLEVNQGQQLHERTLFYDARALQP